VPRHEVNDKLVEEMKENQGFLPYVAITGNAKADNKHVQGIRRHDMQGLMSHNYVLEIYKEHNKSTKRW